MNDELIRHQLDTHKSRLDDHSKRIDELEKSGAANNVKIDNLCDKLEAQTKSINWLIGIIVSSLFGFFIYAIQTGIFN